MLLNSGFIFKHTLLANMQHPRHLHRHLHHLRHLHLYFLSLLSEHSLHVYYPISFQHGSSYPGMQVALRSIQMDVPGGSGWWLHPAARILADR